MTEETTAAASSSSGAADAAASAAASGGATAAKEAPKALAAEPSRGVDLLTSAEGELLGFSVSPVAQVYGMLDKIVAMRRIMALPIAERYALAGKVAAVPTEYARIAERLASTVGTSQSEAGGLNALYVLETCKELVPGFKDSITEDRLQKAAEMSAHKRVQDAVLHGQKPTEWEKAAAAAPAQVVLLPQHDEDEDDDGLMDTAGRAVEGAANAVGDGARFVGGAAFGGLGLVSDTLGLTDDAEGALAETAEDAVDLVGDGVTTVVDSLDAGLDGTADDFAEKGVVGAVGDGVADAVDMVSDFVGDAVHGIADGVQGMLNWAAGEDAGSQNRGSAYATHKLVVVVGELFGQERSLGLRLENRIVTKFTLPEAEKLGFILGDCIVGVGNGLVHSQEDMLAAIGARKEALKTSGAPIHFLVERLGPPPAAVRAAQEAQRARAAQAAAAAGR